jgi:hypothetical protein
LSGNDQDLNLFFKHRQNFAIFNLKCLKYLQ